MSKLIQLHLNKMPDEILKIYAPNFWSLKIGREYWIFDRCPIVEGRRILSKNETLVGAYFAALQTV